MENYLIVIIRTILGYVLFFLLMKFMGKREIGQISLFDFIIILSIADLMVMGIDNFNRDILFSFLPMIIVAIIQKILAVISLKSSKIRNMLDGDISYTATGINATVSNVKTSGFTTVSNTNMNLITQYISFQNQFFGIKKQIL